MGKKRKAPGINATSSADIAFMLLLFFLMTSSMDTDKGLPRRLPQPPQKDQVIEDTKIKKRNMMVVQINSTNQVAVNGEYTDVKNLKNKVKEFIENVSNDESKPEKIEEDIPYFGKVMITKNHVISLQNDRGTEYQAYIDVQNELAAAYNELRNDLSQRKFGKTFDTLDEDQQAAVMKYYKQGISEAEPKNYGGGKK